MRFLFYSHDGFGLGHTRRHLAVASALGEMAPDVSILIATGADYIARLGLPPHVEVLKLPSLCKTDNEAYASRHLQIPAKEIRALRSALLTTTVKEFRPDVVLVDKHPFGAGGEFKPGLKALRKQGGRAALGFRDILDEPAQVLAEWRPYKMQKRIAEYFDQVLIYGDRAVFDPVAAYEFSEGMAARTRFCGYALNGEHADEMMDFKPLFPARENRTRPVVLATTGGGEDGFNLLETFIRAAAGAPWQGVVVTGPMSPTAELNTLQHLADENGVVLRAFVPQLASLFWQVDGLVCMGGYNTLVEAVSKGVPTVSVPRVKPRTEQLLRARAFEQLGLLRTLHPERLTAETMREEISAALGESRQALLARAQSVLKFDGARQAARNLLALGAEAKAAPRVLESKVAC